MKILLSAGKFLTDVLAVVTMGWLTLAVGGSVLDAYQFERDPEAYRIIYEAEAGAAWQAHYMWKLLLIGLLALAALVLLGLYFRRGAKPWQVTARRVFGAGFVLLLVVAYWQWALNYSDH